MNRDESDNDGTRRTEVTTSPQKSQRRPTPRPSDGVWAEMVVQDSGCKSNKSSALASPPTTRANLNIPSLDESREPAIGKVVCSSPRGKVMVLGLPSPRVPIDNFMTLSSVPELDEECSDDDE